MQCENDEAITFETEPGRNIIEPTESEFFFGQKGTKYAYFEIVILLLHSRVLFTGQKMIISLVARPIFPIVPICVRIHVLFCFVWFFFV